MTGQQLDIFAALNTAATATPTDDERDEPHQPPKRTQMTGPLPGTTFEDAFGKDAA